MLAIRRNPSILVQQMITPKRIIEPIHPSTQDAKISLRRGKPNTIRTGLKDPTPMRAQSIHRTCNKKSEKLIINCLYLILKAILSFIDAPLENETPRASRSRGTPTNPNVVAICKKSLDSPKHSINRNGSVLKLAQNFVAITQAVSATPNLPNVSPTTPANMAILTTPESCQHWTSGEILNRHLDHLKIPLTGRPSVQKIRSENLGKVSAHVRKFDRLASPTVPDARCVNLHPSSIATISSDSTPIIPHRTRSPRKGSNVQRQLSDSQVKDRSTPPKISQISPLRESQRANALPQSAKGHERYDVKVDVYLLCDSSMTESNFFLMLFFSVSVLDQSSTANSKSWNNDAFRS